MRADRALLLLLPPPPPPPRLLLPLLFDDEAAAASALSTSGFRAVVAPAAAAATPNGAFASTAAFRVPSLAHSSAASVTTRIRTCRGSHNASRNSGWSMARAHSGHWR
eukprot:1379384-Prymnesium_polylepis.2